jgi:hypothetical protein
MCEECDEVEPIYVAYYRKAGGELWRPPQRTPALKPPPSFACDEGCADPDAQGETF